jgi:hypothetical protein
MDKQNKIRDKIIKIWKDPVWSKVISAAIIFIIVTIWAKYSNYTNEQVYNFFILVLTYKIPIFLFLSIIGLYFISKLVIKLFKKKNDPIWDEQVGNYTFKELYQILSIQNYPVGTVGMGYSGRKPPENDLLSMFHTYSPILNRGIGLDDDFDGGYLYGVLSPKLISYGLVDKIETKNIEIDVMDIKYQTSEIGHKFFALLEKTIHLNSNKESPNR